MRKTAAGPGGTPVGKERIEFSAWQLAVAVAATGTGSQIVLAPANFIKATGQWGWITIFLGAAVFYGFAFLMLKLAAAFPDQPFTSYTRQLTGKYIGVLISIWLALVFYLQFCTILHGFSREVTFSMFVRTPEAAVGILFLLLCTYGALQSWKTIVRIQEVLVFTALIPLFLMWLTSFLNFNHENLLPLIPRDPAKILKAVYNTWDFYSGYEVILILYPLLHRLGVNKAKAVAVAFGSMAVFFATIIVLTVGVLTAKTAASLSAPTLLVIKGVEIPGTFLERLELYLVYLWLPVVYDTMVIFLAVPARILAELTGRGDYRHYVIVLAFFSLIVGIPLEFTALAEKAGAITTAVGVSFSAIVVPALLIFVKLKQRKEKKCAGEFA